MIAEWPLVLVNLREQRRKVHHPSLDDLERPALVRKGWPAHQRAQRLHWRTGLTTEERAELAALRKDNREPQSTCSREPSAGW